MAHWSGRVVAFDLETTGLELETARIVTACIVELDASGSVLGSPAEWLVNPGIEIPSVATAVHGISTQFAAENGISPQQAVSEIVALLSEKQRESYPLVVFNAPYDLTILRAECRRNSVAELEPNLILDPLVIDRKFMPYRRGKRTLTALCEAYQIPLYSAHNSTSDAVAAGCLAQKQFEAYSELAEEFESLQLLQSQWSDAQSRDFEQYMRKSNPAYSASYGWPLKG